MPAVLADSSNAVNASRACPSCSASREDDALRARRRYRRRPEISHTEVTGIIRGDLMNRIIYLATFNQITGGLKMIVRHVECLQELGFNAVIRTHLGDRPPHWL